MELAPLQTRHVKAADLPLDRIASNHQVPQAEKIGAVSQAFEALLFGQILRECQKPVFQSKLISNSTTNGIYRDMVVEQLAQSISKSHSLGLAQSFAGGLGRQSGLEVAPLQGTRDDPATAARAADVPASANTKTLHSLGKHLKPLRLASTPSDVKTHE